MGTDVTTKVPLNVESTPVIVTSRPMERPWSTEVVKVATVVVFVLDEIAIGLPEWVNEVVAPPATSNWYTMFEGSVPHFTRYPVTSSTPGVAHVNSLVRDQPVPASCVGVGIVVVEGSEIFNDPLPVASEYACVCSTPNTPASTYEDPPPPPPYAAPPRPPQ